ncbi:MAG: hypothetical protein IKP88_05420 [Lachnospiraceae bacterium]|nr:hypothetical protein [Lachnospiraceae bacterium]
MRAVKIKKPNHRKKEIDDISIEDTSAEDSVVEYKKGIVREYDMVRSQIDNAIARMDTYYIQAVVVLAAGTFFQNNVNIFILAMGLVVTLALQLKILECKNMVSYNAAYLMVFIENRDMGLMYETRVQRYRTGFWGYQDDGKGKVNKKEKTKDKKEKAKEIFNLAARFGYRIKNALVGAFALIFIVCYVRYNLWSNWNADVISWIKLVVISILAIANLVLACVLCFVEKQPQKMAKKWKEIQKSEIEKYEQNVEANNA